MYLILFSLLYTLFMCLTVSNIYNNNYNIYHACSILFSYNYSLFCSQRRSLNRNCFVQIQLYTKLIDPLIALSCLFVYARLLQNVLKVEGSCSRILQNFISIALHPHTCLSLFPSCLLLVRVRGICQCASFSLVWCTHCTVLQD